MTTVKKNTIRIHQGNSMYKKGAEEMAQYVRSLDPAARFLPTTEDNTTTYSFTNRVVKGSVSADELLAILSNRYGLGATFESGAKATKTLSPENFLKAIEEVIELVDVATGGKEWFTDYIATVRSRNELKFTSDLLTTLTKLEKDISTNACTAQDRSEVLHKLSDPSSFRHLKDLVAKAGLGNQSDDVIKSLMETMKRTYFGQSVKGKLTVSSPKKDGIELVILDSIEEIETIDVDEKKMKLTHCRPAYFTDSKPKRVTRISAKVKAEREYVYVKCNHNGSIAPQDSRILYNKTSSLEVKKSKAKKTTTVPTVKTNIPGIKATNHTGARAETAEEKKIKQKRFTLVLAVVTKYKPDFLTSIVGSEESVNPKTAVATEFDKLPSDKRGGLIFNEITEADFDKLSGL